MRWLVASTAAITLLLVGAIGTVIRFAVLRRLQRFETAARQIAGGERVPGNEADIMGLAIIEHFLAGAVGQIVEVLHAHDRDGPFGRRDLRGRDADNVGAAVGQGIDFALIDIEPGDGKFLFAVEQGQGQSDVAQSDDSDPRLARIAQPLAQIAASVPATALFPVVLLVLIRLGGGLGFGSIVLLLLGTQWYILFNVIAGAIAIPTDLKEAASVFGIRGWERWRKLILPAIFPFLVTGMITASGGAWNVSIVAEYCHLKGQVYSTVGIGAMISAATDAKNFNLLLASTIALAAVVVTTNRLVWRRLYRLAETRFKLDS